jgi:hypothetical protein
LVINHGLEVNVAVAATIASAVAAPVDARIGAASAATSMSAERIDSPGKPSRNVLAQAH